MTDAEVTTDIHQHLETCALQHGVRIVLAAEVGGIASGTASPGSRRQVRFVYAQPVHHYASPWVEELPTEIQATPTRKFVCTGMDLRQLMRELANGNPDVFACLQSTVVYLQHLPFTRPARALLPAVFRPALAIAQYRQRVWSIRQRHLTGETVWPAMYLCAFDPLLAAGWADRHGTPPPLAFDVLLQDAALQPALHADVQQLLLAKRSGAITALAQPHGVLDFFIGRELQRDMPNPVVPAADVLAARAQLGQLFQHTLQTLQR